MKLWLIAKSNMRKKKGNVVILFFLILLATMLLYTSISVLKNINTFMDEKNEAQNGAHACLIVPDSNQDKVEDILKSGPGYDKMESEQIFSLLGTNGIKNVTKNQKKSSMSMLFGDLKKQRTISDWNIVDEGDTLQENSIVLPMYLKVANGYETGDQIDITFGKKKETFIVYGFTEDVMFATPSSVTTYRCMIQPDKIEELKADIPALMTYRLYNVQLKDVSKSEVYEDAISKMLSNQITDPTFYIRFIVNFTMIKSGNAMFINILMAILAAFSIMIILIALVVIKFSITSNLEENLPNVGISEALGYTTKQLILATMMEYLLITVYGIFAGFLMAGVASGFIAHIVSGAIGLSWIPKADLGVAGITILLVLALILGILYFATRRYKKISPLDALRVGISTHNFKKNYFPLEKRSIGLNSILGIKNMLHSKKQNISVILIVTLLVYTCVLCLSMYYNFVGDNTALINLIGIEKPNVQITYNGDGTNANNHILEEEERKLGERSDVEKTNLVGNTTVTVYNDETEISLDLDIYQDVEALNLRTLIAGRRPKHDNEINMTNVIANKLGLSVGDSINIKKNDQSASYVVVGITQQIANMGKRMLMSQDGMLRLDSTYTPTAIYIYFNENVNASKAVDELKEYYDGDTRFQVVNFDESYNTILKTFTGSISALCVVFVIITIAVVILIVLLIVRIKLVKEKRNMGVYKAIGYTTPQIIWQTVMSFSPIVGLGALVGAVIACLSANQMFVLMLSACGIENVNLKISIGMSAACFASVTILAFLVAAVSALGVRKIEPYKMIVEN